MNRIKSWMLMQICVPLVMVLPGCLNPHLFSRTKLPAYEMDFSRGGAAVHKAAANTGWPYGAQGSWKWRYIVIHHSATDRGSAKAFDRAHRKRGWDELGYHFVIDNGKGGPDGRVETGSRWIAQKYGAHCGGTPGNEYNSYGIGICLVGRFDRDLPSASQLVALDKLVTKLADTYHIPAGNIISHRSAPNAHTDCPGDALQSYVAGRLRNRMSEHVAAVD